MKRRFSTRSEGELQQNSGSLFSLYVEKATFRGARAEKPVKKFTDKLKAPINAVPVAEFRDALHALRTCKLWLSIESQNHVHMLVSPVIKQCFPHTTCAHD